MPGEPKFPDFLIIGAMKCGTTSLHDYLGKHPDIYTTDPKELHFFTNEKFNPKKIDWYKNQFRSEKKICGTSPQSYTKRHLPAFQGVPKRLKLHMPEIKLIYLVRDPIKRLISHHSEAIEQGFARTNSLIENLEPLGQSHYIQTSRYYFQLEEFLEHFPLSQIKIVESEKLKHNRLNTLNEIFEFLGVENLKDEKLFAEMSNTGLSKQKPNILGKALTQMKIINSLFPRKVKDSIRSSVAFKELTHKSIKKESLNSEDQKEVENYLAEDINKLRKISNL